MSPSPPSPWPPAAARPSGAEGPPFAELTDLGAQPPFIFQAQDHQPALLDQQVGPPPALGRPWHQDPCPHGGLPMPQVLPHTHPPPAPL